MSFYNQQEERSNSVTIGVADEHIGLVVGRGGRNIFEISQVEIPHSFFCLLSCWLCRKFLLIWQLWGSLLNGLLTLQLSGARIKISERGDFMSGTSDRYEWFTFVDVGSILLLGCFKAFVLSAGKLLSRDPKELSVRLRLWYLKRYHQSLRGDEAGFHVFSLEFWVVLPCLCTFHNFC